MGNGHLSYRAWRIPWDRNFLPLFATGVTLFWVVAWRRRRHDSMSVPTIALILGAAATGCASRSTPNGGDAVLATRLDQKAPVWLAATNVPSIAVAYVRDSAVRWTRVYGEQEKGVRATPRTLYNTASLAKPLSAEIILRLAAAGRVSLDEPLSAFWIDSDVVGDSRHRLLTLRIALGHRTGFKNWRYLTDGVLRFEFTPGTELGYSGEGYEYAKRFVEKKLGTPWDSLAREYVFEPLRMQSTSYTRQDWFAGRMAMPFGPEGTYGEPSTKDTASAADDLYTTVGDYATFLAAVMSRDGLAPAYAAQRDSIHVVNRAGTADCNAELVSRCPRRVGMGLGWEIIEIGSETVRVHTGSDWGEQSMVLYFEERREGAVMLSNGAAGLKVMIDVIGLLFPDTDLAAFARSKR